MIGSVLYYWDTCIFFHWLKGTELTAKPECLTAIKKIEDLVDSKKVSLLTSVITSIEFSQTRLTREEHNRLDELFSKPNVDKASVTSRVSGVAVELNEHYRTRGISLQTPDIIHLATAIHFDADILHTTDGSGKKRCGNLLGLSEEAESGLCDGKYQLGITIPSTSQLGMFAKQDSIDSLDIK